MGEIKNKKEAVFFVIKLKYYFLEKIKQEKEISLQKKKVEIQQQRKNCHNRDKPILKTYFPLKTKKSFYQCI